MHPSLSVLLWALLALGLLPAATLGDSDIHAQIGNSSSDPTVWEDNGPILFAIRHEATHLYLHIPPPPPDTDNSTLTLVDHPGDNSADATKFLLHSKAFFTGEMQYLAPVPEKGSPWTCANHDLTTLPTVTGTTGPCAFGDIMNIDQFWGISYSRTNLTQCTITIAGTTLCLTVNTTDPGVPKMSTIACDQDTAHWSLFT